jgi:DNA-binding LacI/PurR family transcriptional regulator
MKKNISIKDVAKSAGVSVSAVSAVLNGKLGKSIRVGKDTQNKIWDAAAKLGYVPNPAAQNLVRGRSYIVSVFTYEAIFPFAADSEFYSFLLGIERQSEIAGYDLLLLTNRKFRDESVRTQNEAALNRLKLGDGGILIGIERQTETIIRLIDEGFPLVFVGRRDMKGRPVNMVSFDYVSIIEKMMTLACESGHRKSVYLRLNENTEPYMDRQLALDISLKGKSGLSNKTIVLPDNKITDQVVRSLLQKDVTLIILERFSLALQLEALCKSMNIVIGDAVSVILFEDQWFSSDINWTCWNNVRDKLGENALTLLDNIINKKVHTPATITIEPEIVTGETLKLIPSL